jgi:hypothetical protein
VKYFTPSWAGLGDCDSLAVPPEVAQEEFQAVIDAYGKHVARLLPSVPPDLHDLVQGKISLHDGLVLDARLDDAGKDLRLLLRCGNCQDGYFDLELRYGALREPRPTASQLEELLSLRAEALCTEFDRTEDGLLVHRILFWKPPPYRELEMVFDELSVAQTACANGED